MFCQRFRFAGNDLQSTVNHLDIENKGMICCICGVNFDFALLNTPPEMVPLDRTNGAAKPQKWCMVTAAMVH